MEKQINIKNLLAEQKRFFYAGKTRTVDDRVQALEALADCISDMEAEIFAALEADLGKSPFEAYTTEIAFTLEEIRHLAKHVKSWAKPDKVSTPLVHQVSTSHIHYEPYGQVLIISPWNYPFQLALSPLAGAIAAGNTVLLKTSSSANATGKVLEKILAKVFPPEWACYIDPSSISHEELLAEAYDYIFFTGSVNAGRSVMQAAAKHLCPVTLELGGKSPCIVDSSADIDLSAKRIIWGKLLNSGQTCVAPDYCLVEASVESAFIQALEKWTKKFYGDNPLKNAEYPKIINEKQFDRLCELLEAGAEIAFGGQSDKESRKIAPTVLRNVKAEDPCMQEEIFGPILPIVTFTQIEEAIDFVRAKEKPLALYLFTSKKPVMEKVTEELSFGGGCINDVIVHLANPNLPFGGVGQSGMGQYHGKESFLTFSHKKSVLEKKHWLDPNLRYAPFEGKLDIVRKFMG